eukprot:m.96414 g.96414  ORF g.96414 m.96414 type:complete len:629 (+) comp36909_c0_seq3:36-1922(+)
MGLVSGMESSQRQKLLLKLSNNDTKLGFIALVAGLAWFLALAHESMNGELYVDENALVPGLAREDYARQQEALSFAKEWENLDKNDRNVAVSWLQNKLLAAGLEVYLQNFSVEYPFPDSIQSKTIVGTNVYGIHRAPRGTGAESIVLSAPYRVGGVEGSLTENPTPSHYGVSLLLSLSSHFQTVNYWSKDVIFLFSAHDLIGVQAWLDSYTEVKLSSINADPLIGRAGTLQSALNIEMGTEAFNMMEVDAVSINGMVPNYDAYSSAYRVASRHGIPVGPFASSVSGASSDFDDYALSVETMLKSAAAEASGIPLSSHGLFVRYRVEAVTLRTAEGGSSQHRFGLHSMGRVVEGVARCMNNLLEHLHHSFFFYILPKPNRFVSVSLYAPSVGLVLLGPILRAISLWLVSGRNSGSGTPSVNNFAFDLFSRKTGLMLPSWLICFSSGVFLFFAPNLAVKLLSGTNQTTAALLGLGVASLVQTILSPLLVVRLKSGSDSSERAVLECFALVYTTVFLAGLSMINFALGFLVSIVTAIPILLIARKEDKRSGILGIFILLMASPPLVLLVCWSWRLLLNITSVNALLQSAFSAYKSAVLTGVRSNYLIGSWSFMAVTLGWWPSWLLLWTSVW